MKIVIGHKVINLEELFNVSQLTPAGAAVAEVVVDAQINAELGKQPGKDKDLVRDYNTEQDFSKSCSQGEVRAIVAVKLVQLLKLKGNASTCLVNGLLKFLNEWQPLASEKVDFFETVYDFLAKEEIIPSEKERYILNALPHLHVARQGLVAYMCRESFGYLNAVLALSAETAEFPVDYFNEYSLTQRGRTTQGVNIFKSQMLALVADSKKRSQKADLTDAQKNFKLSRAFNLHSALSEKCLLYCTHLQNECNSDDAAIFQNKKYKDLMKLSVDQ